MMVGFDEYAVQCDGRDASVVDHLLTLAGDHVADAPRTAKRVRHDWPLAEWQTCGGRDGYGIAWSFKAGPSMLVGSNALAAPAGAGAKRIVRG